MADQCPLHCGWVKQGSNAAPCENVPCPLEMSRELMPVAFPSSALGSCGKFSGSFVRFSLNFPSFYLLL